MVLIKLQLTVRFGGVTVFENRQLEPLLNKDTEDDKIFYRSSVLHQLELKPNRITGDEDENNT